MGDGDTSDPTQAAQPSLVPPQSAAVSGWGRAAAFALIVLAVLAIELIRSPHLLESWSSLRAADAKLLLGSETMDMGQFHLHRVRVSRGQFEDAVYMARLGERVNAIAISAFSQSRSAPLQIGSATRTVLGNLSADDRRGLQELLSSSPAYPPGKVQQYDIRAPPPDGPLTRIRYVLVVRAQPGDDRDARDALRNGLSELFAVASRKHISGLVVPTLTVDPDDPDSPDYDQFFSSLFEALRTSSGPPQVDVSLYTWNKIEHLESATAAFNANWAAAFTGGAGVLSVLHRFQIRGLLVGLALCLFVSGLQTSLTPRTATIVAVAYAAMVLGSVKTIETLLEGASKDTTVVAIGAAMILEALLFPQIVHWTAKDLFPGGKRK